MRVDRLLDALARTPILERETFQLESTGQNRQIELRRDPTAEGEEGKTLFVNTTAALNVESPRLKDDLRSVASGVGFAGQLLDVIVTRLVTPAKATYTFDAAATEASQKIASAEVAPVVVTYVEGEVLYKRGETLTGTQLSKVRQAMRAERSTLEFWGRWSSRFAAVGLVIGVALAPRRLHRAFCAAGKTQPDADARHRGAAGGRNAARVLGHGDQARALGAHGHRSDGLRHGDPGHRVQPAGRARVSDACTAC